MKPDAGTAVPLPPEAKQAGVTVEDGQVPAANAKSLTVSDIIESLGLTKHHHYTILLCWLGWFFSGYATTLITFLLDAGGGKDGAWVSITSPAERLTIHDRSVTLLGVGVTSAVAFLLLGNLSDFAGRIPVLQGSVFINACATIGMALARGKLVLIMWVLLAQLDASALVTLAVLAEWLPVTWRGLFIVSTNAFWNAGRLAITLLWAALSPTTQWTTFFLTASVFPVIFAIYLIARAQQYESPRWLAVSGNVERCMDTLRLAAATASPDSKQLPHGWDDPANLQLDTDSGEAVHAEQRSKWAQLAELRDPKLKQLIAVLGFCFFAVSFAWSALFYWIMEYLKLLGADAAIVPVMIAAPLGKIVSVAVLIVPCVQGKSIVDWSPRALLMKVGFFGSGLCVALLCCTTNVIALTVIVFVSQVFEGLIWSASYNYTAEAFPTTVRNSATGVTWMIGNIGFLTSAAVCGELMEIWVYLPMVASAVFLFAGCAASFLLTDERGGTPLIDTMGYGSCDAKLSGQSSEP